MLNSAENKGIGMDPLKRAAETVGVMGLRIRPMDVMNYLSASKISCCASPHVNRFESTPYRSLSRQLHSNNVGRAHYNTHVTET
ncbi:Uncharacterized protein HZ326_10421 [Fusarium oxysporum f. sp. albedinis]|nr:Uncharacterized protein HZ326_10421 [Fusarium oxysporum f. sp. albedinis]